MNSKLLSEQALTIIDQYMHFKVGGAVISIPYYNNNHKKIRAALRATVGKGSLKDIYDETELLLVKEGPKNGAIQNGAFKPGVLTSDTLKHFLVDEDIGIDCSGFAYYVLNAESMGRGKKGLDRHLSFPFSKGIFGTIRSKIRPAENTGAKTFASDKNSRIIELKDILPGDFVTMIAAAETPGNPDHIIVVSQIEYQNFIPTTIHYTHSMAWPADGEYGHGVRTGKITITDINKPLAAQAWEENGKTGSENFTLNRASTSVTELRRFNWF